jgi:hypothetical protein
MALTLGRGSRGTQPLQPGQRPDDYFVENESDEDRPRAGLQALRVLQAVLFVVITLLSLAVFWMVGLILGIF